MLGVKSLPEWRRLRRPREDGDGVVLVCRALVDTMGHQFRVAASDAHPEGGGNSAAWEKVSEVVAAQRADAGR